MMEKRTARSQPQAIPPEVPAISSNRALVPTLAPVQVLHHAIANMVEGGHQWSDEGGELPPTYARSIGNGKVLVAISPQGVTEPSSNTLPLLWKLARSISWRTLVIAQALLAQWATLSTTTDQAVTISLDRILDYRGLRRMRRADEPAGWQHGHRSQERRKVASELCLVEQITFSAFNVRAYPCKAKGRQGARFTFHNSRLITITDTWKQLSLMPGEGIESCTSHIRYLPGTWVQEYAKAGIRQLGLILTQNLAYDPYHQEWELAMASWLTLEVFPNNAGCGRGIHRAIETILAAIGQQPDQANPKKTRLRLERMMNTMVHDGYLAAWSYVDAVPLTRCKWMTSWLKTRISMDPAPAFDSFYTRRNPRRKSPRKRA